MTVSERVTTSTIRPVVPLHAQSCPGHPDELRWITPPGLLPFVARLATAPEPLAALIDDGTLAEVRVQAGAVVTRLGAGRSWSGEGARVRTALHAALEDPAGWRPVPAGPQTRDERIRDERVRDEEVPDEQIPDDVLLRSAAQALLDGAAGEFARSHGGEIELVEVHDGVVEVRLRGACDGCPAARVTMRVRLEQQLREQVPGLKEIREVGRPGPRPGLARLRTGVHWLVSPGERLAPVGEEPNGPGN